MAAPDDLFNPAPAQQAPRRPTRTALDPVLPDGLRGVDGGRFHALGAERLGYGASGLGGGSAGGLGVGSPLGLGGGGGLGGLGGLGGGARPSAEPRSGPRRPKPLGRGREEALGFLPEPRLADVGPIWRSPARSEAPLARTPGTAGRLGDPECWVMIMGHPSNMVDALLRHISDMAVVVEHHVFGNRLYVRFNSTADSRRAFQLHDREDILPGNILLTVHSVKARDLERLGPEEDRLAPGSAHAPLEWSRVSGASMHPSEIAEPVDAWATPGSALRTSGITSRLRSTSPRTSRLNASVRSDDSEADSPALTAIRAARRRPRTSDASAADRYPVDPTAVRADRGGWCGWCARLCDAIFKF